MHSSPGCHVRRLQLAFDPLHYLISKNGEFYSLMKGAGLASVCVRPSTIHIGSPRF
jgi:hypothetical protein